jgi:hypothetical protein
VEVAAEQAAAVGSEVAVTTTLSQRAMAAREREVAIWKLGVGGGAHDKTQGEAEMHKHHHTEEIPSYYGRHPDGHTCVVHGLAAARLAACVIQRDAATFNLFIYHTTEVIYASL